MGDPRDGAPGGPAAGTENEGRAGLHEGGALAGLRVLVPRAEEQAPELTQRVRELGGEPVPAPTVEIHRGDVAAIKSALRELDEGGFTAVAFTSRNGVNAVAEALAEAGLSPSCFDATLVAAVGPGTADSLVDRLGVHPDLVPDRSTTEALGAAFPPGDGRVLLPRADIASPRLPELLRQRGYEPVEVDAYRTGMPQRLPRGVPEMLEAGQIHLIAFTSSSTVRNFVELVGDRPWRSRVVSIGPVTSATCRQHGIDIAVEATTHDLDGTVEALTVAAADLVRRDERGDVDQR